MNREIPFYSVLTADQKALLDRSIHRLPYKKGQVVHAHEDPCVGLIVVHKGRLDFSTISEEGREIILFRAGEGETCILSAACVFQGMEAENLITAETAVEVSILPAATLARLMTENPDVERIVYKLAVAQYTGVQRNMQRIIFLSLEKRLALFLREESLRRKQMTFSATHEYIARCIGSSREVVTRMLNQFAARDLVSLGRGTVTILDRDALFDLI